MGTFLGEIFLQLGVQFAFRHRNSRECLIDISHFRFRIYFQGFYQKDELLQRERFLTHRWFESVFIAVKIDNFKKNFAVQCGSKDADFLTPLAFGVGQLDEEGTCSSPVEVRFRSVIKIHRSQI